MDKDIEKILLTEEQIQARVKELGTQISQDYKDKNLTCICLLKGGVFFLTDLLKNVNIPITIDFMDISSYGVKTESTGEVKIIKDLDNSINDCHVLIVEDIIDTGYTLSHVVDLLENRGAKSVEIVTFLNKKERRKIDIDIKYCGFEIPDYFVVGYGLDFKEKYRNLPYIGYLKEDLYK